VSTSAGTDVLVIVPVTVCVFVTTGRVTEVIVAVFVGVPPVTVVKDSTMGVHWTLLRTKALFCTS
jgi:hypothetical protein